jgi:DNA-binding MarR family transcriptional regulator
VEATYLSAINLIERLHRQFLEVVKSELDRLGVQDINNIQAIILYNIATEEVTVGELTHRGYYLGSNVSYNLKKMVGHGYLIQERSPHDRRSVRVRLSEKGVALRQMMVDMFNNQIVALKDRGNTKEGIEKIVVALSFLDRFFSDSLTMAERGVVGSSGGLERRTDEEG